MRRPPALPFALLWAGSSFVYSVARAQDTTLAIDSTPLAVVVRNVNLRPAPSTATLRIRRLRPRDELALREDTTTNGFYAVLTADDEIGWVWARNVRWLGGARFPGCGAHHRRGLACFVDQRRVGEAGAEPDLHHD
ncbi:MAG: SH3 domain-containing protein [Gemmatimonadales bacterium]